MARFILKSTSLFIILMIFLFSLNISTIKSQNDSNYGELVASKIIGYKSDFMSTSHLNYSILGFFDYKTYKNATDLLNVIISVSVFLELKNYLIKSKGKFTTDQNISLIDNITLDYIMKYDFDSRSYPWRLGPIKYPAASGRTIVSQGMYYNSSGYEKKIENYNFSLKTRISFIEIGISQNISYDTGWVDMFDFTIPVDSVNPPKSAFSFEFMSIVSVLMLYGSKKLRIKRKIAK